LLLLLLFQQRCGELLVSAGRSHAAPLGVPLFISKQGAETLAGRFLSKPRQLALFTLLGTRLRIGRETFVPKPFQKLLPALSLPILLGCF
jgi:hypothetical protein